MPEANTLMTPTEVAALWDVSRGTVRRYMANGRLPYERTFAGLTLIRQADAEKLLKEVQDEYRQRPPRSPGRPREGVFWRTVAAGSR